MRQLIRGRLGQVLVAVMVVAAAVAVALGVSTMAYPTVSSYPDTAGGAASVQMDEGAKTARITLTSDAARRLGLRTGAISAALAPGTRLVMPADAVFYDAAGDTWAYVVREPLVYQREHVAVASIDGDVATLSAGPPAGTQVVVVGAAELYGTEVGVGEE